MKKYSCLIFLCLLLICRQSGAQISLNPAVDTVHNKVNSKVIRVLSNYLNARLQKKDGKAFWIQAETDSLKNFDFYTAHSLYAIAFDNVIILGITQPDRDLFKAKVLFSYTGVDKVKTIWSINDFYMVKQDDTFKLKNALYINMQFDHYKTVTSPQINYHFPPDYHYQQSKIDSANYFLQEIKQFFNKSIPGKIEYITAPTCEKLYAVLGESFQAGTLSSSTTYCGFFDGDNRLIITSGGEYYKHELLRTLNLFYPNAPDLLKSGITCLWGGSVNKPIIYHLKKIYPYLLQHPEELDSLENFYYFDDETNPQFVLEAIVVNYILKNEGKNGLLKLFHDLKPNATITDFLRQQYKITNTRAFFLEQFKYYSTRNSLEFDDIFYFNKISR